MRQLTVGYPLMVAFLPSKYSNFQVGPGLLPLQSPCASELNCDFGAHLVRGGGGDLCLKVAGNPVQSILQLGEVPAATLSKMTNVLSTSPGHW